MRTRILPLLAFALLPACASGPSANEAEFLVSVGQEQFVLRVRDAATIEQARAQLGRGTSAFPIGPLLRGDGGYNAPWSWRFDPDAVRLAEVAVEVCDGLPSYVERHLADFPAYCPWSARIVKENR